MKSVLALLATLTIADVFPACAQSAGPNYEGTFKMSGFLLRSAVVCPGNQRPTIDKAIGMIATPELKVVSRAYPQTAQSWQLEGAQFFNSVLMRYGVASACKMSKRKP